MKKQFITEAKRFQKLAGLIKENENPISVESFLADELLPIFEEGNDVEYEVGQEHSHTFEYDEYTNEEGYDEDFINNFKEAAAYLQTKSFDYTGNNGISYTFTAEPNGDIVIKWIETL
jgi:hypothetical protein